jgi:hypothetical protein
MSVFVAALAGPALFIVVVESISRLWLKYRRRYYVFPPGLRLHVHPDRSVFPQLPPLARFVVNLEGERGDDLPASTDGLYRILVAGGSQTECYFLDQDAAWPGVVQRLLAAPDRVTRLGASRVHVGCVARSGIGSEALDMMFSRMLPQYPRLQLIVTLIGLADVTRWIEQGTPDALAPMRLTDVFRCHPDGPYGWTPGQWAARELFSRTRRSSLRRLTVDAQAGRWMGRARAMRANARTIHAVIRDPAPMLDHFERHFRSALASAVAHADRVIVIRPAWFDKTFTAEEAAAMWHGGVGQAWREEVTTYYSFDVFSRLMRTLNHRVDAVARSFNVEQLDLMPFLEPSLETFYDVVHLTDVGARQVGEVVAAAILREPLAQRGAVANVRRHAAPKAS